MKRKLKKVILTFMIMSITATSIFADGDGNIDSGGSGGTGSGGSSQNIWWAGDDGVRISIIDANTRKTMTTPIDFTNKSRKDIKYHFGKSNKIQYDKEKKKLQMYDGGYKWFQPPQKIPVIMSKSGNDIEEIKKYFTAKTTIKQISIATNFNYEELVSGKYKLLLEPIMYVTFQGKRWAMTATEAALYNKKSNNALRKKFVSISHKRLPYSMFLEVSDMGFPAYKGTTSKPSDDDTIIQQLGLGIVRFNGEDPDDPVYPDPPDIDVDKTDYEYRTDTDVITSLDIKSLSRVTPDAPITATFHILGKSYTVSNVVIPANSSQLVWVKWHTPKTPQKVKITVSISGGNISSATINANVVELKEETPPDPLPTDRNDKFKLANLPSADNKTSATWGVWSAYWKENWQTITVGRDEEGNPIYDRVDLGDWEYTRTTYSANLSANLEIVPCEYTPPTWTEKNGEYDMKSGYGINLKQNTKVTYNCSSADVTSAQNSIATFSDFKYEKYNRILEITKDNGYSDTFEFKKNRYSTYNSRTHYTPIWYPDETNYIINTEIIDVWTPVGMLKVNLNDRIMINGNLFQDRHIAIMK